MPLQGATTPTRDTQGVASLALGYVLHWAFSPPLLNPKLEFFILWIMVNRNLSHLYPYIFKTFDLSFMFHYYVSTYWISIISKSETYDFNVSFLVSCFMFQNTEGAWKRSLSVFESLPQRFWIAPSVFLFFSLSVFWLKHWN